MKNYGIVVGSTRKNSFSEAVAKAIVKGLPKEANITFIEIKNLPLYNQDYDQDSPKEYETFRKQVAEQDAIIFVTPEYNRSIPPALKNALDIASRPWGQNIWAGKPALVASQSVSGMAGVLANHIVRQSLVYLDMPTMQQPEVYIGHSAQLFDENQNPIKQETADFLENAGKSFVEFAKKFD